MTTEPSTPLHDWTSHVVQAIEFWGVYKKTRAEVRSGNQKAAERPKGLAKSTQVTRLHTPAAAKRRTTLYQRSPR